MTIAFLSHADCERHDTGLNHPESPARVRAILDYLPTCEIWHQLTQHEAPLASKEQLYRAHSKEYVDTIMLAEPAQGRIFLDPDTSMAPHSLNAALRAAGASIKAVDLVMSGDSEQAFCCVRPCGHHAETGRAMGFCLFNNVALGVRHAQAQYELSRIAILDFDVHHGNGTEDIFCHDSSVFFSSTFQHPFYPGSGADTNNEHIVNVPLPAGTGGVDFRAAFRQQILPALDQFAPEMIFISAGFDAHIDDPLAQLCLVEEDFSWVTKKIKDAANLHAQGRLISVLEGGYNLAALAHSVEAHIQAML